MTPKPLTGFPAELRTYALSLPATTEAFPWGERAFKVKNKTFVFMRAEGSELSFSVKLPESRKSALALPFAEPTHYGLGAKSWVTFSQPPRNAAMKKQIREWILESYRAVAPKTVLR
jgi:predicted DNA-binding protein (MmcQ/YjbR family)